ncbi:MAG: DUF637 domain-containing protein, partial [Hydrogenophaga sp.]|nr:DUF637 domain-containing protein [Hydrogenophaga sp.]
VLGTNLEDAIKNNLKSALINTVAAKGAFTIGEGGKTGDLNAASKVIAHALLGCAIGAANAGNGSGCAPGAAGAAIGEIVASLYGNGQNLGGLEEQLSKDPNNAQLKAQVDQIRNTVTELAKLSGAGAALLIGGDASSAQIAMGTASNAAVNNYLNHTELKLRDQAQKACSAGNQSACQTVRSLDQLSADRNATIRRGVTTATEDQAGDILQSMQTTMEGLVGYRGELQTQLNNTTDPALRASLQNQINQVDNNMKQVAALGKDYLAQQYQNTGNPLYQSAFAQLSSATSGNDLADAMSSVMGVQLARLPTRPANTGDAAANAAAKESIDLAAIQRAKVENNANADNARDPLNIQSPENIAASKNLADKAVTDAAAGTYNPHYDPKHGPSTTLQQQYDRAINGTNPQTGAAARPADASKFFNAADMETAIKQAEAAYAANPGGFVNGKVDVLFNRPIGEGYTGNTKSNKDAGIPTGEYRWSNTATVGIDSTTGKAFTAYPNIIQGTAKPDPRLTGVNP